MKFTLPSIYPSDVLSDSQLEVLAKELPQPKAQTGRPAYSNRALLPGILKVLRSGCRWRDLTLPGYPDGVTHWRRLRFWMKKNGYRRVWKQLLRLLFVQRKLLPNKISIDGTLIQSFSFTDTTGYSGKHHMVGTKISIVVEGSGIPISIVFATGNRHDLALARETIKTIVFAPFRFQLASLLADKGYDANWFRRFSVEQQCVPFIPQRSNGKMKKKDQLLYLTNTTLQKQRYVVEQNNSWLKSFRRLRHRFDYTMQSFTSFVYLAILVICIRRLLE